MAMMLPQKWVRSASTLQGAKKLTVMAKRGKRAKQGKNGKKAKEKRFPTEGLWIAPRNSLKRQTGKSGWENRPDDRQSDNRFLELADIALGLERTNSKKR
jgi:hypothetical protein